MAKEEKRVSVKIPRGGEKEDQNAFVGVNGVNYLLPKGKTSEVPAAVKAEVERSERAADKFYEHKSEKKNAQAN